LESHQLGTARQQQRDHVADAYSTFSQIGRVTARGGFECPVTDVTVPGDEGRGVWLSIREAGDSTMDKWLVRREVIH
jgi:hypothetical protein